MFKIKRLKPLEDLLFESELIKYGDQFVGINNDYKSRGGENTENPNSEQDLWNRMNYLLDQLLDNGIIDLEKDLAEPLYEREFGSEYGKQLISAYLKNCKAQLASLNTQINAELAKEYNDVDKLKELAITRIKVAARIETLEKIYSAFESAASEEILSEINNIKDEMSAQYASSIKTIGGAIAKPMNDFKDFDSSDAHKEQSATEILFFLNGLEVILPFYPEDAKEAVNQAKVRIDKTIEDELGREKTEYIKQTILSNDEEMIVLKRIINLKYMHFSSEDQIHQEIDRIKIAINKLQGSHRGTSASRPQVIEYLNNLLAEEAAKLLDQASNKNITMKDAKGIHYGFNARLPLHEIVDLPVTGKQIADSHWIMKFRKRLQAIAELIPTGTSQMTAGGQAWANFGKQTHDLYAKVLNKSGRLIGKMIGGRSGALKGDAITRLLIPGTSVLDKEPAHTNIPNQIPISEEGGAMGPDGGSTPGGSGYQLPGQIGTAGEIKPPTDTVDGSGDNFGEPWKKTKKRRKKKKNKPDVYEEKLSIMNFSNFIS